MITGTGPAAHRNGRRVAIVAATLFIIPGLFIPSIARASHCDNPIATAISVQGIVEEKKENQWTPVTRGADFCPGDIVRVRANSRTIVRMHAEQTNITLGQHATLSFSSRKKETTFSLIELLKGAASFISRVPQSLKIKTPYVNAAVEGTEFLVTVKDDKTKVSVFEGHVALDNAQGKLDLKSGDTALAGAQQAPTKDISVNQTDAVQWTLYYPPVVKKPANAQDTVFPLTLQDENDLQLITWYASQLLSVGRVPEAEREIEKAMALDRGDSNALALKAIIAVVQNNSANAMQYAKQSIDSNSSAAGYIALSYAHQARFELDDALNAANEATVVDANNAIAWARLAELHLTQANLDAALSAANKATRLDDTLARTHTILGFSHLTRIDTGNAKNAFNKAISLDQASPLPHLGLGLAMIREGQLEQGRAEIEAATSLDPQNSLLRSYVGKAYYEEGRFDLAATQFDIAKQLDPKDPTPWFYDAIRKQVLNDPANALSDLEQAKALNDNRAVYRSQLLLDSDEAARSASQARIYKDLGLEQFALLEGWRSLASDPSNYSAHRLLADSYSSLPRHEIARVSEILQAQLLQPINATPTQPQLAESFLGILDGAGPSELAFNEYNRLFSKDGSIFQTNIVRGGNETLGNDLVVSGIKDNTAFSFGQFHYETDGFRDNNDLEHNIYNMFVQTSASHNANVQLEFRKNEKHNGDLTTNTFDPNAFQDSLRETEESELFRLGINIEPSPGFNVLASVIRKSINLTAVDPDVSLDLDDDGDSTELVFLNRSENFNTITGISLLNGTSTTETVLNLDPFTCSLIPCQDVTTTDMKSNSFFSYGYFNINNSSTLVAGINLNELRDDQVSESSGYPKLGIIWDINKDTVLRAAAFKSRKLQLVNNQTLEPTHIAGFNQLFDDSRSSETELLGVGFDSKIADDMFTGISYFDRDIKVPYIDFFTGLEKSDWQSSNGTIYFHWNLGRTFALNIEGQYEQFTTNRDFTTGIIELDTFLIPLTLRYFHPTGFLASITLINARQEGTFFDPTVPPAGIETQGDENFNIVNLSIGYRFPDRKGKFTLEVKNATDKKFVFQDVETLRSVLSPERYIIGRFTFNL